MFIAYQNAFEMIRYNVVCSKFFMFVRGSSYSSSLDCLVRTVRAEGFWALYKGFLPIWARMVNNWSVY